MQLDLYLQETAAHAARQSLILQEARIRLVGHGALTPLEFSGVVHAWQVLVENSIGKAKHWLKYCGVAVPISAYDSFSLLRQLNLISAESLSGWQKAIGLRNRIVHDYLNLDDQVVIALIQSNADQFMIDFLNTPFRLPNE
ncbi:DUF86 domain-containing protein [Chitinibacter sp. SCUT-21]|uniref:type VII toxin-antitoxin system HepT family RNase toxin n=1 Tax=Chitinibacter sp. SCUT-21 TaxID=2970891 RepID=UPI0035A62618